MENLETKKMIVTIKKSKSKFNYIELTKLT